VVPKHRRSFQQSLAAVGAPAGAAEYEPEAVGYGRAAYPAWRNPVHARIGLADDGYYPPGEYDDHYNGDYNGGAQYGGAEYGGAEYGGYNGAAQYGGAEYGGYNGGGGYDGARYDGARYDGASAEADWTPDAEGSNWEWNDWQNWGPPPAMHPDHPSAPVARVQLPPDHPSGQYAAPRRPVARDSDGPGSLPAYLAVVAEGQAHRDDSVVQELPRRNPRGPAGYQREPELPRRDSSGQHRRPAPGWEESTDFRRETGPFTRPAGSPPGRLQNGRSPVRDSASSGGQVLALADGQTARRAQRAEADAAAIREAAERDAAVLRETAEREAAEMRARLESMLTEMNRVSALVTETLGDPAMPAHAPAMPAIAPAMPANAPAMLTTAPPMPATAPARPRTAPVPAGPDTRPARPTERPAPDTTRRPRPDTAPARKPVPTAPKTTPGKPDGKGRQQRAFRIATAGTAALLSVAAIGAVTMTSIHGFSFFVFRESGQGETPGTFTDANFLAGQKECHVSGVAADGTPNGSSDSIPAPCPAAAVPHHDTAPKGRHHKK
jgi:hypothetical protein